jgi:hypothetical protein
MPSLHIGSQPQKLKAHTGFFTPVREKGPEAKSLRALEIYFDDNSGSAGHEVFVNNAAFHHKTNVFHD